MQPRKLKRVVIKEEFIELTGNLNEAVLLNQLLYWQERVNDYDRLLAEEISRMQDAGIEPNVEISNGWIYKKAEELAEETLLKASRQTIRNTINKLIEKGYVLQRRNPKYNWDKTLQYRINFPKLMSDLQGIGYALEGYELLEKAMLNTEHSNVKYLPSDEKNGHSEVQNLHSNVEILQAIPEITSEITSENLKKEQEEMDKPLNPFSFYEQNGFGMLGSYLAEKINHWLDGDYFDEPEAVVIEALKIAIENNVLTWNYSEKVLSDWSSKQVRTANDAKAMIARYKDQKSRKSQKMYAPVKSQRRKESLPKSLVVPEQITKDQQTDEQELQRQREKFAENLKLLRENTAKNKTITAY